MHLENNEVVLARRDNFEKLTVSRDGIKDRILNLLTEIQDYLYNRAKSYREENTKLINSYDELKEYFSDDKAPGFALFSWDGNKEDEAKLKEELKITNRCFPFDQDGQDGTCIVTGRKTNRKAIFAKAY